jgi:NADH dehydrogenase
MQEGKWVGHQVAADLASKPREPFHYFDKGSLATIGRAAAIGQIGKLHLSGFIAWLAWLFVHIMFLIGFRNRLVVMISWAWSYITFKRAARLITGEEKVITLPALEYIERAASMQAAKSSEEAAGQPATGSSLVSKR